MTVSAELPDLTDEHNVGLLRQWENADPTYLHILRFIRICGEFPDVVHITRPGRDGVKKGDSKGGVSPAEVDEMDVTSSPSSPSSSLEEEAEATEVPRVGSYMLAMDEIPQC
jgi:Translation machinery-associated protein 16